MDRQELEDRLSALVRQAQQQPYKSAARTDALRQLIQEIYQHISIIISQTALRQFPTLLQDEIFDTAVQQFILYLVEEHKNIEQYDPDRGKVIQWIQSRFLKPGGFLHKAHDEILIKNKIYLMRPTLDDSESSDIWEQILGQESINILNERPEQQAKQQARKLYRLIKEDPDGKFRNETMRSYPDVNWRDLALKRMEGKNKKCKAWAKIAEEDYRDLNVRPTALSKFFFDRQEREPLKSILADYGVRQKGKRNRKK